MTRTNIADLHEHIGKEVSISGWIDVRRDHGITKIVKGGDWEYLI